MLCPFCGKSISRMIQKEDGSILTPCCSNISEVGSPVSYHSPTFKQKAQWRKEQYDKAPRDAHGSVTNHPNWQVTQDLIETHKDNPDMLSDYNEKRLRDSGVVMEKTISQSKQIRKKAIALKKEGMV